MHMGILFCLASYQDGQAEHFAVWVFSLKSSGNILCSRKPAHKRHTNSWTHYELTEWQFHILYYPSNFRPTSLLVPRRQGFCSMRSKQVPLYFPPSHIHVSAHVRHSHLRTISTQSNPALCLYQRHRSTEVFSKPHQIDCCWHMTFHPPTESLPWHFRGLSTKKTQHSTQSLPGSVSTLLYLPILSFSFLPPTQRSNYE